MSQCRREEQAARVRDAANAAWAQNYVAVDPAAERAARGGPAHCRCNIVATDHYRIWFDCIYDAGSGTEHQRRKAAGKPGYHEDLAKGGSHELRDEAVRVPQGHADLAAGDPLRGPARGPLGDDLV
jgi:hypothetical protein